MSHLKTLEFALFKPHACRKAGIEKKNHYKDLSPLIQIPQFEESLSLNPLLANPTYLILTMFSKLALFAASSVVVFFAAPQPRWGGYRQPLRRWQALLLYVTYFFA
jgi:hypothetical protein